MPVTNLPRISKIQKKNAGKCEVKIMYRLKTIKFKINGICMNKCRFCIFHDNPARLDYRDMDKVMGVFPRDWRGQILINGGEPVLHPDIADISARLASNHTRQRRGIGTNLLYFKNRNAARQSLFTHILACFDLFQIGCDDEHKNIDVVERIVPEIIAAGKEVYINCLLEYCSKDTRARLEKLDQQHGSVTRFVHAKDYTALARMHLDRNLDTLERAPCSRRYKEVLIDCDGKIFFCFNQEFADSSGNIHDMTNNALRQVLFEDEIKYPFRACKSCQFYKSGLADGDS